MSPDKKSGMSRAVHYVQYVFYLFDICKYLFSVERPYVLCILSVCSEPNFLFFIQYFPRFSANL